MIKYSPVNLLLGVMLLINPWISTAKLIPDKPNKTNCVLTFKRKQWANIFLNAATATIHRQPVQLPRGNINRDNLHALYLVFINALESNNH